MNGNKTLLHAGAGSLAIKAFSMAIGFTLTVVLARNLGAAGYGIYAFVLSLIMFLAIPAQVGLPQLVIRETAKAYALENWGLMRGLWLWSDRVIVFFTALMIVAGLLALWGGSHLLDLHGWKTMAIGLPLVPLIALTNVRGAALRGLQRVVVGQLPEQILRPGMLLILVFGSLWWWKQGAASPEVIMLLHCVAALSALLIGVALLQRLRPPSLKASPGPAYQSSYWRKAMTPLALLAGLQLINAHTDIIMLGIMRTNEEVGVYRVVVQMGMLVIFGLQAINQYVQPLFARLHQERNEDALQKMVTRSARLIFLLAFPPMIVMVSAGGVLLAVSFGEEYRMGALALGILAMGQLVNAGMGSVAVLLNMTGYERDTAWGVAIAAVSNVLLNALLIPPFGLQGAALATAITLIVWNIVLRYLVHKRLGIESSIIGARICRRVHS